MKHILKSLALVFALALTASAFAHDKHDHKQPAKNAAAKSKFLGKGDGVTTCPVTGEKFENKDNKAVFFGRTVYFCCADCLATAKKNPAAYIKRTQKEQLAAIKNAPQVAQAALSESHDHHAKTESQDAAKGEKKFLGKGDGIETCPVMGEPVNKNLKYEVNGRVFYVCCEGCAETVKKNPDLYLKPIQGEKKAEKKEGQQEQAFLGKGDGIETCPVTGEAVNKELKAEADGQTFYVCCAGCIDTVKKNPAAYLKKAAK
jgi:YHS domain-containing protein